MVESDRLVWPPGAAGRLAQRLALLWHVEVGMCDQLEAEQVITAQLASEWRGEFQPPPAGRGGGRSRAEDPTPCK